MQTGQDQESHSGTVGLEPPPPPRPLQAVLHAGSRPSSVPKLPTYRIAYFWLHCSFAPTDKAFANLFELASDNDIELTEEVVEVRHTATPET